MPAYNFTVNLDKIADGTKLHTFRLPRKDGQTARPGQTAFLFTQMRTKACLRLGERPIYMIMPMVIHENGIWMRRYDAIAYAEWLEEFYNRQVDCPLIHDAHCDNLKFYPVGLEFSEIIAVNDGFDEWAGMLNWARKTHKNKTINKDKNPTECKVFGFLICWNPPLKPLLNVQTKLAL